MKVTAHVVMMEPGESGRQFAQACALHARLERVMVQVHIGNLYLGEVSWEMSGADAYERLFHRPVARVHQEAG